MTDEISAQEYERLFLKDTEIRESVLMRALEIRKFEIELYWRRASYFWTLIGASLVVYGAAQSLSDKAAGRDVAVLAACLGFVFSFAWFFAIRGSKQWQENWENHVDLLEQASGGPLYAVVLSRTPPKGLWEHLLRFSTGPGPYSVSKINQIVSVFMAILWLVLAIRVLGPFTPGAAFRPWYGVLVGLAVATTICIATLGRTRRGDQRFVATRRRSAIDLREKQPESST